MPALGVGLGGGQQDALAALAPVRAARGIVERLNAGDYEGVAAAVDPAVPAGAFSADALRKIWSDVAAQQGALTSYGPRRAVAAQGRQVVDFDATFERQPLTLRVVVDDEGRLSGLWLLPPEPPPYRPPPYVDPARFSERELTLGDAAWPLPATVTLPVGAGPFPAVVLLHGSGPNDRDESIGPNRPFRDLADGLASRGIAVLRYDKRTRVHGARMVGAAVGLEEEVVADALAALDTLRRAPGADPGAVFLLGHSLGATLAPAIAARDAGLAGLILMAAATVPVSELTAEQLRYIASLVPEPSPELQAMIATVDSLRAGNLPESTVVLGAPVRYWREVDAVRPVEAARRITTPLLILQGGRDYQVPPRELGVWRRELGGRPRTTLREFPALNHLFMAGTGPSTPEEYALEGHVDGEVIEAIAGWMRGR